MRFTLTVSLDKQVFAFTMAYLENGLGAEHISQFCDASPLTHKAL